MGVIYYTGKALETCTFQAQLVKSGCCLSQTLITKRQDTLREKESEEESLEKICDQARQ